MTLLSSYNYATLKSWGLYSYVPSCIMLRLMIVYEGIIEILHHDFFHNKLGFEVYVFVGRWGKEELTF